MAVASIITCCIGDDSADSGDSAISVIAARRLCAWLRCRYSISIKLVVSSVVKLHIHLSQCDVVGREMQVMEDHESGYTLHFTMLWVAIGLTLTLSLILTLF